MVGVEEPELGEGEAPLLFCPGLLRPGRGVMEMLGELFLFCPFWPKLCNKNMMVRNYKNNQVLVASYYLLYKMHLD